ncbi:MAG: 23S rRNA (guanosine(2251)-2'-O)-methyltransferase RlmB [Desulfobacteraceae bacterium 4572_130]|nr:MAG: 23S rRNA (guanosine(2251)-2'-O)-methyltransferase RlmB [Desulfobacteraceae bacterium 4572_130]
MKTRKKQERQEILLGLHSVYEALKAGKRQIFKIFISRDFNQPNIKKIINFAIKKKIPFEFIKSDFLDVMTKNSKHQGIAAKVGHYPLVKIDIVFKEIKNNSARDFILIIECLEDPHNLGALIRTALCVGIDFIMIPKNRAVYPSPSVSRASAGALEHANISLTTNTVSVIQRLKNQGFWIAGLDAQARTSIFKTNLPQKLVLIVGGEHKGIRPLVKKQCDFLISLPQKTGVSSLNASVAGGAAMYEVFRQKNL